MHQRKAFHFPPLFRPTLAFCIGIGIGLCVFPTKEVAVWLCLAAAILACGLCFWLAFQQKTLQWGGVILLLAFFTAGLSLSSSTHAYRFNPLHVCRLSLEKHVLLLQLEEMPAEGKRSVRVVANMLGLQNKQGIWQAGTGRVLLQLPPTPQALRLKAGTALWVYAKTDTISKPLPTQRFDYAAWLARRGILRRVWAADGDWNVAGESKKMDVGLWSMHLQAKARTCLANLLGPKHAAMAATLLLGSRETINAEIQAAFVRTGTIHILSVSGFHVALLAGLVLALARLFGKGGPLRNQMTTGFCLLLVWAYVVVCGWPAPAVRAGYMLSVGLLANTLGRPAEKGSLFCGAMLVLVAANPASLFDVGFQLSFGAIAGLFWVAPLIEDALPLQNPILRWVWKLCAATLGAQLAIFPFLLYHFGQLPVWFLAANLVAIPLCSLLLYALMGVLAFGWLPVVGSWLVLVANGLADALTAWLAWVAHWPFAVLGGLGVGMLPALLLGFCLLCWVVAAHWKQKAWVWGGIASFALFVMALCAAQFL